MGVEAGKEDRIFVGVEVDSVCEERNPQAGKTTNAIRLARLIMMGLLMFTYLLTNLPGFMVG